MAPLDRFSEPTRTWFGAAFAEPTPAQVGAWEAIGAGRHALVVAPTGSGKTLSAFLWSLDRLLTSRAAGEGAPLPGPLRLPAEGAGGRRRAQPPRAAHRHPPHRRPARRRRPRRPRRRPLRRHLAGRPAQAHHLSPGHHDHDPRVAVPDAHLAGPRVAARRRDRDRRRGARRRRHQARRPPRRLARAARRAARPARAADRPVRDGPPARGGRPLPRRHRPGRDRRAPAPRSGGTSRSSCRSRT